MRLIDADALKTPIEDRIDNIPASEYDNGWNNAIYAVIDEIDNAPTVETNKIEFKAYNEAFKDGVEQGIKLSEKPQGEWIRTGSLGNGNAQYECSNCHYGDKQAESQEVPYCWHCGASMQKGGAE